MILATHVINTFMNSVNLISVESPVYVPAVGTFAAIIMILDEKMKVQLD